MYDIIERLVWAWQRNHRKVSITRHAWGHLKDDLKGNLPRREAAEALRIIRRYEKEMTGL